jgi:hypothetical protein
MRIGLLLAAGVGLLAVRSGLGYENDGPGKAEVTARAAAQRTAAPDQPQPGRNERPTGEDHVRHHGALGVLLSKSDEGVLVVGVISGSAAARSGLRSGDEIRFVGDQRIRTIPELTDTVGGYKPGTPVDLIISRNGKRQVVEATLGAREVANGDRPVEELAGPAGGVTARVSPPAARGRAPDAIPTGPVSDRERQMSLRMRAMERQLYRLQQDLNEVRYTHSTHAANSYDASAWWDRQHHGQADDDPALFQ